MAYNIATDSPLSIPARTDIQNWINNYKDQVVEHSHDQAMLSLVNPDDSLLVVGPPRLAGMKEYYLVGMITSFQYNEQSNVQPFKAIGSRRHIFGKTNAPVQGGMQRVLILGNNLLRALYAVTKAEGTFMRNANFAVGANGPESSWYVNLEEDIFRIPIGIGIIYNSVATASNKGVAAAGAEYIEACTLTGRSVQKQAGQAIIMENVQFIADRVVPWDSYKGPAFGADNPVGSFMS